MDLSEVLFHRYSLPMMVFLPKTSRAGRDRQTRCDHYVSVCYLSSFRMMEVG